MFRERKRGKKEVSIALLALLVLSVGSALCIFSNTVSAVEIFQINDPYPVLKVTFDKPVYEYTAHLYDYNSSNITIALLSKSDDGRIFRFQPDAQLNETLYKFVIQGNDSIGNLGELKEYNFRINITTINITLKNPKYGASSTTVFDLMIETGRNAVLCKYYGAGTHFFNESLNLFTTVDARTYAVYDFNNAETGGRSLNVICNDTYGKINNDAPARFTLYYDPTPPVITSFTASPPFITEESSVSLRIETDDETICKFDKEDVNFDLMAKEFPGYNISSFSRIHNYDIPLTLADDNKTSEYYSVCMNRAENISRNASVSFTVDRSTADSIVSVKPSGDFINRTVYFEAITNKDATCIVSIGSLTLNMPPSSGRIHKSASQNFVDGIYAYLINCTFDITGNTKTASDSFSIDSTPPIILFVNDTNFNSANPCCTCVNTLFARWAANESSSHISGFFYQVVDQNSGNITIPWTFTTDDSARIFGMQLSEGHTYVFEVIARNSVGLNSTVGRSDGVIARAEYCLSGASSCYDTFRNGDESDVDCGGSCPNKCAEGKSCIENLDCITNLCDSSSKRCVKQICQNGKQDSGESDVDCGGSCPNKCDDGSKCTQSSDCTSKVCSAGFCQAPSCTDLIKNGDESDVDCGSYCPKCKINLNCFIDDDCDTGSCDYKKCVEATCEDGKKDGDESDVDCGGSCSTKCDLARLCSIHADCSSLYCNAQTKKCDDYKKKDSDNDGLPDWWMKQYFGSETCSNSASCGPNADPDKDGYTNLEEYFNNTNPLKKDWNPASLWVFLIILVAVLLVAGAVYFFMFRKPVKKKTVNRAQTERRVPEESFGGAPEPRFEPQLSRKEVREKMKEKQKERLNVFSSFEEAETPEIKKAEIKKPLKPVEKKEVKPKLEEKKSIKELRKEAEKSKKEELPKHTKLKGDVFKRLPKKKTVFDELEELRKPKS